MPFAGEIAASKNRPKTVGDQRERLLDDLSWMCGRVGFQKTMSGEEVRAIELSEKVGHLAVSRELGHERVMFRNDAGALLSWQYPVGETIR